jgi:hypothetical protein
MRLFSWCFCATLTAGLVLPMVPGHVLAQQAKLTAADPMPEAPQPQFLLAAAEIPAQDSSRSHSQAAAAQQPATGSLQRKETEKQFLSGMFASSSVVYGSSAASLSPSQKMVLALRSTVEPLTFAKSLAVGGYHVVLDDDKGFGGGMEGYGKASGAAYLGSVDSKILGRGIFPSLLHQDPRYFRLGHGSMTHRALYAFSTAVIAKHDTTGKWEPNYSNVLGEFSSVSISYLYYPALTPSVGKTFSEGISSVAIGSLGSVFSEFWPDVSRKFLHRDPSHGLDAEQAGHSK